MMAQKVLAGFAITFAGIGVLTALAWWGFRFTTTVVHPAQPVPSADHPDSRCSWCHRMSEDAPLYPPR